MVSELIRVKRAYDSAEPDDGQRILVDRLWPRGLRREAARLDGWLRAVAPSDALRRWYGHRTERWEEFRDRYHAELEAPERQAALADLQERASQGPLTLLCAARDPEHSNAAVLCDLLKARRTAG